jgi:hypothetical protein
VNQPEKDITVGDAQALAEAAAKDTWGKFADPGTALLSERVLEGEHCWFIFRNPAIQMPATAWYSASSAYAVSRRGRVREIPDYSSEPERLNAYLDLMSAYFAHVELGAPKPTLPSWIRRSENHTS